MDKRFEDTCILDHRPQGRRIPRLVGLKGDDVKGQVTWVSLAPPS